MNQNFNNQYFYTEDNFRIFFSTNFSISDFDKARPLLVFNYGLVCNNEHWRHQVDHYNQQGYAILVHDYRCHYSSSGGEEEFPTCTFKNFAKDLDELISHIGAQNVFMFGHSMGVNITLEYARRYPEKLTAMTLISGTPLAPQEVMFNSNIVNVIFPYLEKLYQKRQEPYKLFWKTSFLNPLVRKIIFSGGFNINQVPEEFVEIYMKRISELHPKLFLQLFRQMKEHDILSAIESIETPALVVAGDKDKVVPLNVQRIIHQHLKNSRFFLIKEGSHVPQVDFYHSINERCDLFIKENSV